MSVIASAEAFCSKGTHFARFRAKKRFLSDAKAKKAAIWSRPLRGGPAAANPRSFWPKLNEQRAYSRLPRRVRLATAATQSDPTAKTNAASAWTLSPVLANLRCSAGEEVFSTTSPRL